MRRAIELDVPDDLGEQVRFGTFDVDPPDHQKICAEHKVMGPPFLAYYRNGHLVQTVLGVQKRDVMIRNLSTLVYGVG